MTPIAAAVGFYGKLPCRGDFLRRRVPQEFMDVWDAWLQECLAHSRQALQERWLDAYLTSPVWRFALAEGVCGTGAYAGVMVPSVDRVGRYFPLTIVAQWHVGEGPLDAACGAHRWFEAAEALAMEAPDTTDLDSFDDRVAQLAERIDTSGVGEAVSLRDGLKHAEFPHRAGQWHVPLSTVGSMQRAVTAIATRELERTLRPLAIWWTDGSDGVPAAWLTTRGLPAAESFDAMLTGEFANSGWNTTGAAHATPQSRAAPPTNAATPTEDARVPPFSGDARSQPTHNSLPARDSRREADIVFELGSFAVARFELRAYHEPISRKWDAPPQSVFFVTRPEVGLWGVCASGDEDARHAAAQAVADVLQSVPPAGTLTSLVEETRRSLIAVRRQLVAKGQGVGAAEPYALCRAMVFLAHEDECAILCFGDAQAVRNRAADSEWIMGVGDFMDAATLPRTSDPANSLLDIVTGAPEPALAVRYESLQAGDTWLIAAALVFEQPRLATLTPPDLRAACTAEYSQWNGPLPALMLTAAELPVEA